MAKRQLAVGPKREKISGASNASRWRQIAPDSASWRHFLAPDPKSGARWRSDRQIFPDGARWRQMALILNDTFARILPDPRALPLFVILVDGG